MCHALVQTWSCLRWLGLSASTQASAVQPSRGPETEKPPKRERIDWASIFHLHNQTSLPIPLETQAAPKPSSQYCNAPSNMKYAPWRNSKTGQHLQLPGLPGTGSSPSGLQVAPLCYETCCRPSYLPYKG